MLTNQAPRCLSVTDDADEYETHHEEYLERQKEIIRDELHDNHAALVLDFLYDKRGDLAPSTARNYARELRFLLIHSYGDDALPNDPERWETVDWTRTIRRVAREREISEGARRLTCYAARAFVEWLPTTPAEKSDIEAPPVEHEKIDEEVVLEPSEVVHLIKTANTERDAAIIAVMYEAALRRTALVQLDVSD